MLTIPWAIAKKEIRQAVRENKWRTCGVLVMPAFMQWLLLVNSIRFSRETIWQDQLGQEMLQMIPTLSLAYLPLLMIPYLANIFLLKSMVQERVGGAILPVLCTGVNVGVLFTVRTLAIFGCCYLISLLFLDLLILIMVFVFTSPVICTPFTATLILVAAPLVALAITAILHFVYCVVSYNALLTSALPLIAVLGLFLYGGQTLGLPSRSKE
jgi:ABC-type transport system involved in multi-copper enzyme maturation permease subunit